MGAVGEEGKSLARTNTGRHRWIAEAGPPTRQKKKGASELRYPRPHVHIVDGGKARVILGAFSTGAEGAENLPMPEMPFRSRFRWSLPRSVAGDSAYGTRENVAATEKAGHPASRQNIKRLLAFGTKRPRKSTRPCPHAPLSPAHATRRGTEVRGGIGRMRWVRPGGLSRETAEA